MKRAVLVAAALVCLVVRASSAYAQSDFIDWLEGFSGPGPFHTYYPLSIGTRVVCGYDEGNRHRVSTCLADIDPKIKTLLTVDYAWASSHNNERFVGTPLAVDPLNTAPVNSSRILVNFYYRLSPMFDIGAGGGAFIFTGDGFENQTHPILTPLAVTFTPFGYWHSKKWVKWGRVIRVKFAEKYVLGDIRAADFHSPSTYLRNGEFNPEFRVGFDFWSFLSRSHQ
jgi:hypothetical protein